MGREVQELIGLLEMKVGVQQSDAIVRIGSKAAYLTTRIDSFLTAVCGLFLTALSIET